MNNANTRSNTDRNNHQSSTEPSIDSDPCDESSPLLLENTQPGTFTSPNYPNNYPNNMNCSWIIRFDNVHQINLVFTDFDIEADKRCR